MACYGIRLHKYQNSASHHVESCRLLAIGSLFRLAAKRYARHRWMWRLWGSILLSKWRFHFNLASTYRIVSSDSIASSRRIASSDRISYLHTTTFNRININDAAEKYWPIKEIEQLIKKKFVLLFMPSQSIPSKVWKSAFQVILDWNAILAMLMIVI